MEVLDPEGRPLRVGAKARMHPGLGMVEIERVDDWVDGNALAHGIVVTSDGEFPIFERGGFLVCLDLMAQSPSSEVLAKAERMLRNGQVIPAPEYRSFFVHGDTGGYITTVGPEHRHCTCEHGKHDNPTDCSHLVAVDLYIKETQ